MSNIQNIIIAVLKEEKKQRKEQEKMNLKTGQQMGRKYIDYGGPLTYGDKDKARRLHCNKPPSGKHQHAQHQKKLDEIWTFITGMDWEVCDSTNGIGISWIELMVLFEIGGHCEQHTTEGHTTRLREALDDDDEHTKRWRLHLAK